MKTIFTTPVFRELLSLVARAFMRFKGYKITGENPPYDKYVLVCAPHTSNWDFIYMLCVVLSRKMDVRWMGKRQLFRQPFKYIMIWLGGIPIERSTANNTVDTMVDAFNSNDRLTLLITPEGTRSKVRQWKTGFYHIAKAANVPIVLGYLDARYDRCGFGPVFERSDDIDQDIAAIKHHYKDMVGLRPELGVTADESHTGDNDTAGK